MGNNRPTRAYLWKCLLSSKLMSSCHAPTTYPRVWITLRLLLLLLLLLMASFPDDCLPPEGQYDLREALVKAINSWASTRGYAFVMQRSTRRTNGLQKITYSCDRGYHPPNPNTPRQRKTTAHTISCPFSVLAKEESDGSIWVTGKEAISSSSKRRDVIHTCGYVVGAWQDDISSELNKHFRRYARVGLLPPVYHLILM